MKNIFHCLMFILIVPILCGAALVVGYVLIVVLTIPQLPVWAQPGVTEWLFDIPQDAESSDNGSSGDSSSSAGPSAVTWDGYVGPGSDIHGLPLVGPIQHWSTWYDKPLLGCVFHDPHYGSHTGDDFPVNEGTPVHTPMGGKVVWAGSNGPWGNLVVVENNGYQVWLAHLSSISVSVGDILNYGDVVGLSGNTGNSTGAHLHYGIKQKTGENTYVWLDPRMFFTEDEYINIGCSD
jgi:murein DD-endopeptidase MepM/ murein hydrolase activator NlpD